MVGEYAALFAGRLGAAVFGVVSLSLSARLLGVEGYGQTTLIMMIGTVVSTLLLNWPNAAIIRFGREEFLETGQVEVTFWSRSALLALCAAVIAFGLLILRQQIAIYVGLTGNIAVTCIWLFATALALYEMTVATLQSADRVAASGAVHFLGKGLLAAFLICGWWLGEGMLAPTTVVAFQVTSLVLVALGALWTIRRSVGSPRIRGKRISQTVDYTWAIVFGSAGGVVVRWVDLTVIKYYLDLESVGTYAVAYQITTFLGMATASVTSVVFPAMVSYKSKGQLDRVHAFLDAIIPQAMLAWNILLAIVCVAAQGAIPLLLGPSYAESVWPLQLLLVGLGFNAIGRFYTGVTNTFDLLKRIALLSVSVGIINLVGDLILIPRIGIQGAAISTLLAFAVTHQSYIYLINRSPELDRNGRRYLVNLFPLIPAAVALAGRFHPGPGPWVVLVGACIISVLLGRQIGLFSTKTIEWIQNAGLPHPVEKRLSRFYSVLIGQ